MAWFIECQCKYILCFRLSMKTPEPEKNPNTIPVTIPIGFQWKSHYGYNSISNSIGTLWWNNSPMTSKSNFQNKNVLEFSMSSLQNSSRTPSDFAEKNLPRVSDEFLLEPSNYFLRNSPRFPIRIIQELWNALRIAIGTLQYFFLIFSNSCLRNFSNITNGILSNRSRKSRRIHFWVSKNSSRNFPRVDFMAFLWNSRKIPLRNATEAKVETKDLSLL